MSISWSGSGSQSQDGQGQDGQSGAGQSGHGGQGHGQGLNLHYFFKFAWQG